MHALFRYFSASTRALADKSLDSDFCTFGENRLIDVLIWICYFIPNHIAIPKSFLHLGVQLVFTLPSWLILRNSTFSQVIYHWNEHIKAC
jgi:hypothetical protein